MKKSLLSTALLVEPNEKLTYPYNLLPSKYHKTRFSTIAEAQKFVTLETPKLICLSASFSSEELLLFLENLQKQVAVSLPKLIFVIDLKNPLSCIPGVSWGQNIEVITSQTTDTVVSAIFTQ